ncbi:ABC transporter permease [Nodosilinea sp. FACHB-13]|uniref:ABC transporter permease n=1 Tax=Cyanophyceae TaxID=3028117 RepID=UPI001681CA4A|nr:ABC transporter permease [Nodosilinea sp. FACHB-13]MBD2109754.1 ABC transporter permease [Nodosilinea sp. FACHB-13]
MQQFSSTPNELVASFWRHRELIGSLIQRDIVGRYRGSALGIIWSFIHPMFMLAVYTFVFSVVFQARWGNGSDSKAEFALVLFAGLIVFNLFAECVNRASGLITSNVNYVKRVVFPLEILPWVTLGSALFHGLMSIIVWLVFYIVLFGLPKISIILLPAIILPLIFLTMGLTWFFAALGVYLRDISQVTTIMTTVLMFLSPIFYPASALPQNFQPILLLNPLTPALEQFRGVLMWGEVPRFHAWVLYLSLTATVGWLGFAWFQKVRRGFSDVL